MLRMLFVVLVFSQALGEDPWRVDVKERRFEIIKDELTVKPSVYAAFYKRLVNFIVSRLVVEDDEAVVINGNVMLKIKQHDWEYLNEKAQAEEPLNDATLRKVDSILSEGLVGESPIVKGSKNIFKLTKTFIIDNYKLLTIIFILLTSLYFVKDVDKNVLCTRRNAFILAIVTIVGWEYMIVHDEWDSSYYHSAEPHNLWKKYFHPFFVLKRVFNRIFSEHFTHMINFFFTKIDQLTASTNYFIQTPVRILMYVLLIYFMLALLFGFIFNILLNRPFSINFFMFGFDLKEKIHHHNVFTTNTRGGQPDCSHHAGDRVSGDNLNSILKIMEKVVSEKSPEKLHIFASPSTSRLPRSECRVDGKTKPKRFYSESRLQALRK